MVMVVVVVVVVVDEEEEEAGKPPRFTAASAGAGISSHSSDEERYGTRELLIYIRLIITFGAGFYYQRLVKVARLKIRRKTPGRTFFLIFCTLSLPLAIHWKNRQGRSCKSQSRSRRSRSPAAQQRGGLLEEASLRSPPY